MLSTTGLDHSTGFLGITSGSWPDWVAAIFTSLAFLVAAFSYARSIKERREAQARLVYSKLIELKFHEPGTEFDVMPHGARYGWMDGGCVGILPPSSSVEKTRFVAAAPVIQLVAAVHNGSKELIGPAKVQVVNTGRKNTYDTFSVMVNSVDPESEEVVDFIWPNVDYPGQPGLGTTVLFRDASSRWWRRHLIEPIEAVHDDPENDAYMPAQRAAEAKRARAMGIQPSPKPKVPLRAQWHRFWRRLRGKSPIP